MSNSVVFNTDECELVFSGAFLSIRWQSTLVSFSNQSW